MTGPSEKGYLYPYQPLQDLDHGTIFVLGSRDGTDAMRAAGLQAVGFIGPLDWLDAEVLGSFAGLRTVLVPAACEDGVSQMLEVGRRLTSVAGELLWYEHEPGANHGMDMDRLLWPGTSLDVLHDLADDPSPTPEVIERLEVIRTRLRRFGDFHPIDTLMRWRGVERLDRIITPERREALLGRIEPQPGKVTLLYGPGGVGKGLLVAWWVSRITLERKYVLILDYEGHADEWRRRIASLGGDPDFVYVTEPLKAVGTASPQGSRPFWQTAGYHADTAGMLEASLVVVDSLVFASVGHDVNAPDAAMRFMAGAALFPCPVLALGHVNRASDYRYPFGSAFWHNGARMTWSLEPQGGGETPVLLTNRKAQNYEPMGSFKVQLRWLDGDLTGVTESAYCRTLRERIEAVLSETKDGMTEPEIITALNEDGGGEVKANSVNTTLNRKTTAGGNFSQDPASRRWTLLR